MWIELCDKKEYNDCSQKGMRLRFEKSIDLATRSQCISFCKWLRTKYFFPIRIYIYVYDNEYFIEKGNKTNKCCGLFFDGREETKQLPRIWIAARQKAGIEGVFLSIVHELTHYYQWYFNDTDKRTSRSLEIEANRWAYYLLGIYADTTSISTQLNI